MFPGTPLPLVLRGAKGTLSLPGGEKHDGNLITHSPSGLRLPSLLSPPCLDRFLLAAGLTAARGNAVGEDEQKAGPANSLGSGPALFVFTSVFWSLEQFLAHSEAEAQQKKVEYMREKGEQALPLTFFCVL